jgi:putative DNA primase/helicase
MGFALDELGSQRCREIAEGLFEVEKVYGQKLHGFCPIHGDQKSASFCYHFGEDWYKCRSCSAGGDLVKLWCELNGLDSHGDGFVQFKKEFVDNGLSPSSKPRKRKSPPKKEPDPAPDVFVDEEELEALPPLPAKRLTELRRLRGWSAHAVEMLDLREFDDGHNKKIAIPIRDDQGRLCNIRLYQPGAERCKMISWYDRTCKACGGHWKTVDKAKVCKGCGASPNCYGATRLFPAPTVWKQTGPLWLVEGEPDLICAISNGLNAVTQTAGCGTWRDEFSEAMAGRDVIIAYDADQAGHKGAHVAAKSIVMHAQSVRIIQWPEVMG